MARRAHTNFVALIEDEEKKYPKKLSSVWWSDGTHRQKFQSHQSRYTKEQQVNTNYCACLCVSLYPHNSSASMSELHKWGQLWVFIGDFTIWCPHQTKHRSNVSCLLNKSLLHRFFFVKAQLFIWKKKNLLNKIPDFCTVCVINAHVRF